MQVGAALLAVALVAGGGLEPLRAQAPAARVADVRPLVQAVYAALRDGAPASGQVNPSISFFFFKGVGGTTYIPFTLTIERDRLRTAPAVLYVLATPVDVAPDAGPGQMPARPSTTEPADLQGPAPPPIAFEAVHVLDDDPGEVQEGVGARDDVLGAPGAPRRLSRAVSLPPGRYDLFVALSGAVATGSSASDDVIIVESAPLTVPDLWRDELTTSTPVVVQRVEELEAPVSPDQQVADPFALGPVRLVPAPHADRRPSEQLAVTLFVYNPRLSPSGVPDVTVDYLLYREGPAGRAYVGRTPPQEFDAATMAGFDAAAGHEVVAGQAIPLRSFSAGMYHLDIRVTDHLRPASVVRRVTFTVSEP